MKNHMQTKEQLVHKLSLLKKRKVKVLEEMAEERQKLGEVIA